MKIKTVELKANNKAYSRAYLFAALKEAGLPHTAPNFLHKYEKKLCEDKTCPFYKQPYLVSPRSPKRWHIYTKKQITNIIETVKTGWFIRHWHWRPG